MKQRLKPYRDWAVLYWRKVLVYSLLALAFGLLSHQVARGFNQIEDLVNQSDRNGRAIDCILTALDTGDTIKKETIQECRRKQEGPTGSNSPDIPTPDPQSGPSIPLNESPATVIINRTSQGAVNPAVPPANNPPPTTQNPPLLFPGGQGIVRDGETVLGLPLGRL